MVAAANDDHARGCLLLEMALETEVLVALHEHPCVHAAVRVVAGGAAFMHGLVFKDERSALSGVAARAGLVLRGELRATALDRVALVRVVAIGTTDFALRHGVMMRQAELTALVEMALEARLGRLAWIDDGVARPATLRVKAAGAVAGFAAHVQCVVALGDDPCVRRSVKSL